MTSLQTSRSQCAVQQIGRFEATYIREDDVAGSESGDPAVANEVT